MDNPLQSVTHGQCDARPAVTFPAAGQHGPLSGTKLYCLVTEARVCKQLAQGCYLKGRGRESNPRPSESQVRGSSHCATVSVGAVHPGLQCCHAAVSAFCQPSPTCRTAFPVQHLRPSGVFSCWPDGLELTPGFYPGSNEQHRLV